MADMSRQGDLVLSPHTYAFVLDKTKGKVSVYVGPTKTSLSDTDQLTVFEPKTNRFKESHQQEAITPFQSAVEGEYIVLSNPAVDGQDNSPRAGSQSDAVPLDFGRKVNIPGPSFFPLWPGQTAKTLKGHHLRNNQYLLIRVYDETQAQENWSNGVVKSSEGDAELSKPTLTMGQLLIIKGTEVSFFIPPTGLEVVPENETKYVRDAITLERLEYCILLNENGMKRFVEGPEVVFPSPTETFITDNGKNKFKAFELNNNSGMYIKVIADYKEDDGTQRKVGDELFITGKEEAIYFPRSEHSIIEYDEKKIHYAIAIPAGEGRYVLDKNNGKVVLVTGPQMFLPDPRNQVIVRRILAKKDLELIYPGNQEAIEVNEHLTELMRVQVEVADEQSISGTLSNVLSESSVRRGLSSYRSTANSSFMAGASPSPSFAGDSFVRKSTYTPPRSITLDTKYEGAVCVSLWPGYATMISNKTGERRVEVGPKVILLDYDETLLPVALSTGKPKTTDKLLNTVYVCVRNNKVSDYINVETKDLVPCEIRVSYRVSFEGDDPEKWFDVENYVKFMCDHVRSILKNTIKHVGIEEFHQNSIDIIRDAILGKKTDDGRPGLFFEENNMRIHEVEVFSCNILNSNVASLLQTAQQRQLSGSVALSEKTLEHERLVAIEDINRKNILEKEKTAEAQANADANSVKRTLLANIADAEASIEILKKHQEEVEIQLEERSAVQNQELEMNQRSQAIVLAKLEAETKSYISRMEALGDNVGESLRAFSDKSLMKEITQAVGVQSMVTGNNVADILSGLFKGTPLEGTLAQLSARPATKKSKD